MFAFILIVLFAPLLFGMWFAFFPSTVPRWVLAIPLMLLDVVWKAEQKSMVSHSGDRKIIFGARPEDDWRYRNDQIDAQPGLENSTLVSEPDPARVRILGVIILAVWMGAAVWLKSKLSRS